MTRYSQAHEHAQVLGNHLRADPSSAAAVHCLWPLAGHCGACLLEAVGGTLRYLDLEPCLGAGWAQVSGPGDAHVWACLVAALQRAAGEAVAELDAAGAWERCSAPPLGLAGRACVLHCLAPCPALLVGPRA